MKNVKLTLAILIYLAGQHFFNPLGLISGPLSKVLLLIICGLGLFVGFLYGNKENYTYPNKNYKWIIIGIALSIISMTINYDQSFVVSLISTLPFLFAYAYFYILLRFRIDKNLIIKFMKILVLCSFVMYLVNLITFPNIVFGASKDEYDETRGFVRLGVPMIELVVLYLFYVINQWIIYGGKKWGIWIFTMTFLVVMSLTRQVILLSFCFSFLMILHKAKIWKKISVLLIFSVFSLFLLPKIPIYQSMVELSERQAQKNKEDDDIRIKAWKFYTMDYQKNLITSIFGNGVPSVGNSKRGNEFEKTISYDYGGNGCFYVDVGWAGFYWLFGAFSLYGLLMLLLKSIRKSYRENQYYLFYWFIYVLISSIASATILFTSQILSLCIAFYLLYGNDNARKQKLHGTYNFKL